MNDLADGKWKDWLGRLWDRLTEAALQPASGWEDRIDYAGIIPFGAVCHGELLRPGYHRDFDPGLNALTGKLFGRSWKVVVNDVLDEFDEGVIGLQIASQNEYALGLVQDLIAEAGATDGYTQAEFARLMGVDRGRVSKWLGGKLNVPLEMLLRLPLCCSRHDARLPLVRCLPRERLILGGYLRATAFVRGLLGRLPEFQIDQEAFLAVAYYHAEATPTPRDRSETDHLLGSILRERVAPSLATPMKLDTLSYRAILDEWEAAYLLAIKALAEERSAGEPGRVNCREEIVLFRPNGMPMGRVEDVHAPQVDRLDGEVVAGEDSEAI
jgi:transcriptional regulator with XRE-family HTH domain